MMKVAFVAFDFGEYCVRQAAELARHADVLLVLPSHHLRTHERLLPKNIELHTFDAPRLRQPWRQWRTMRAILRRIHAFGPDVVHFQRGHLWFNLALPWLRRYPLVITIHDPRHHVGDRESRKTPQAIMDFGYRRADQVIVHGQPLKDTVVGELGFSAAQVHVVPHVAIGQREQAPAVAEEPGLVLFFGRIWEYKGLDYLIRAEPHISAAIPHARFLIAGDGEDLERCKQFIVHPERFEIHNRWISDEERSRMFQRAAVVVLPYVAATQSGVVPVAYSNGKPVVATTVGGLPEVIEDGRTGLLVPPRDEAALAEAVIRLLADDDLRHRMGVCGREKLEQESSPAVVIQQTLEVYRRAMEGRQPIKHTRPGTTPAASASLTHEQA